jgi:hypothetical protein
VAEASVEALDMFDVFDIFAAALAAAAKAAAWLPLITAGSVKMHGAFCSEQNFLDLRMLPAQQLLVPPGLVPQFS